MTIAPITTPVRAQKTCAKKPWITRLLRALTPNHHPHLKDLKPHQLRDIGISDADIARFQHYFPSQHDHHPRG